MNRVNKTESAVFLYCRFSLFLKDPFSRLFTVAQNYSHMIQKMLPDVCFECLLKSESV